MCKERWRKERNEIKECKNDRERRERWKKGKSKGKECKVIKNDLKWWKKGGRKEIINKSKKINEWEAIRNREGKKKEI